MNTEQIARITEKNHGRHGGLISILEEIQHESGYLSENALRTVATETGCSLVDIYGVATFYKAFRLKPRGKHLITACQGTACHVRGAPNIVQEIKSNLGISEGETTSDKEFTFETVNCLGTCALGPIVVIDGRYFSRVTKSMVSKLIAKAREGFDRGGITQDPRIFPLEAACPFCNHSLMDRDTQIDGHPSIKITVSSEHKHGWLRLSCLYGSHNISSEHKIVHNVVLECFCPHCHTELSGTVGCPECGTPMIIMLVCGGGMLQLCPRRGCKGHMLEVNNTSI